MNDLPSRLLLLRIATMEGNIPILCCVLLALLSVIEATSYHRHREEPFREAEDRYQGKLSMKRKFDIGG